MDAGIADTINRIDAQLMCERLDALDHEWRNKEPWYGRKWADALAVGASASPQALADRSWVVGAIAARTPGLNFDGSPADADWENLFSHFRAEIEARRNPRGPETPPAETAENRLSGVV